MTSPTLAPVLGPSTDLGLHLPMTVYHAAERWHPERIGALGLYC